MIKRRTDEGWILNQAENCGWRLPTLGFLASEDTTDLWAIGGAVKATAHAIGLANRWTAGGAARSDRTKADVF